MTWSGRRGRSFIGGDRRIKAHILCTIATGAVLLGMVLPLEAADKAHNERARWRGREAAFRSGLEADGFVVQEGYAYPVDPIADLLDAGLGDTANANNAGQPYKVLMIPPHPIDRDLPIHPGELAFSIFRIRPDEAIVYVGPTPPLADYFSFTPYLWVRRQGRIVPKGDFIFAAVNDPLNNALIKTEGRGNPFHKQTVIVFTADQGIFARVADQARAAGYPRSMVNAYILPSELLHLGVLTEDLEADTFVLVVRSANFVSRAAGDKYLADGSYATIWRVTPESEPALDPYPTPPEREHEWISERTLFPGLEEGLQRLEEAIRERFADRATQHFESMQWWPTSRQVLEAEDDDPRSDIYHQFIAGEASDTPYLRSAIDEEPANFILDDDDLVVVYGVNHEATGLATYSSLSLYGDWITSSCETLEDQREYVFGCGDHIWNGVAGMNSHEFSGSAEEYIPGDPMAPYLYAVKVVRRPPSDTHEKFWVVVPEPPCAVPPCEAPLPSYNHGIALDKPITIGYRAYLNPATGAGPAYDDMIWDRAIWVEDGNGESPDG
jgi:hypothetical protein